jgi:dephospho-CoA kinase
MLKIGITGGIGSGKSTICKLFQIMGIPVFNSDVEAKILMDNNPEIKYLLIKNFGNEVFNKNNILQRNYLARIVFSDKDKLILLNSIIHPRVADKYQGWLRNIENLPNLPPYVIREAAIMFESGSNFQNDYTVLVFTEESTRISRVVKRDHLSLEEIRLRIKNQLSENEKLKRSNFVIYNSDIMPLLPQIMVLHNKWMNTISE